MTDKKIARVSIFSIKAEKQVFCGPPAFWGIEAAVDVTYEDNSSEIRYISTIDLSEAGWQVCSKSIADLGEDEDISPYVVAAWGEDELMEALTSPYGAAIKQLDSIFEKIAVI